MKTRVEISIPGKPKAKGRPRFSKFGAYTPKETEAEENYIRELARKAMQGEAPMLGPVRLRLEAVFDMPASWPLRLREMTTLPHISKPDLDNIEKLSLDALNGIVFADDAQICELSSSKRYGDGERVDIRVELLETTSDHPALRAAKKRLKDGDKVETRSSRAVKKRRRRSTIAPAVKEQSIGKRIK